MSLLLHRDTCAAWIRGVSRVRNRFAQRLADLHVAARTIVSLATWLLDWRTPVGYQVAYMGMMQLVKVVALDRGIAERAALIRSGLSQQGRRLLPINLMVAATALDRGLTLETHDTQRFSAVPGLTLVDWLIP